MAEPDTRRIAHDLLGEPHIRDRRVSVRQVSLLVEEHGESPQAVADRYDLDVADVYHALAYYHDHPSEMNEVMTERGEAIDAVRESIDRPDGVDPDDAATEILALVEAYPNREAFRGQEILDDWV